MTREIKFRAWDKKTDTMRVVLAYDSSHFVAYKNDDQDNPHWENDFELMQYTGLKDKNGNEIYEGDIVELEKGKKYAEKDKVWNNYYRATVVWEEDDCGFTLDTTIRNGEVGGHELKFLYPHVEVIGNIYENKDLLDHE